MDKPRWAAFLKGWEPKDTAEPFTSKHKKQKVNSADLVKGLLEQVHVMVKLARQDTHPRENGHCR